MFHEVSHGLVAYWLGDDTAKNAGRLTLNPISHLDPIGTLCMIIAGFGWAKPVPVRPMNFKNRKLGMALTALAGPIANFILAFVLFLISMMLSMFFPNSEVVGALNTFMIITSTLSVGLGVFNLIPIPPLDGYNVLQMFLPSNLSAKIYNIQAYCQIALIVLIFLGALNGFLSTAQMSVVSVISQGAMHAARFLGGLFGIA